ncbi:MAG: hypothetical protein WC941_10815 [Candidatus Bathyarchaeia archaeon]
MKELSPLVGKTGELLGKRHASPGGLGLPRDDLFFEFNSELLDPRGWKLDRAIELLHELLGLLGCDVGLGASGSPGPLLTKAVEVEVGALGQGQ